MFGFISEATVHIQGNKDTHIYRTKIIYSYRFVPSGIIHEK